MTDTPYSLADEALNAAQELLDGGEELRAQAAATIGIGRALLAVAFELGKKANSGWPPMLPANAPMTPPGQGPIPSR